jgi:hypothetical protein
VNLLGHNIDTVKKKDTVIDVSKESDLIINAEKTRYMLLSCHQNAGGIKVANRSFENVSQFKYLGTTETNQNLIQEEIRGIEF